MPFGLHSAPATFQRMIDEILRDCTYSFQSHTSMILHFQQFMCDTYRKRSVRYLLLTSMCQFGHAEAHYLGHIIGQGKVEPGFEVSHTYMQGLGYCRHFIDHFVTIITPLTTLPSSRNQIRSAGLQNLRRLLYN